MVCAQTLAIGLLLQRLAEDRDIGTHGVGNLDAHMAQTAESDNRHAFAGSRAPVVQRRVERDAGAEQGGGGIER